MSPVASVATKPVTFTLPGRNGIHAVELADGPRWEPSQLQPLLLDIDVLKQLQTRHAGHLAQSDRAERLDPLWRYVAALPPGPRPHSIAADEAFADSRGRRNLAVAVPAGDAPASRFLLQSIAKVLRPAFVAPQGFRFVDLDFDRCALGILGVVSLDAQLRRDLEHADLHERVGYAVGGLELDHTARRKLGKLVNVALPHGMGAKSLQAALDDAGLHLDARGVHDAWWRRYALLRAFYDGLVHVVRRASGPIRVIDPAGRVRSLRRRRAATLLSTLWTCIEATILDLAFDRLAELPARLVLPMFDGLLGLAPAHQAQREAELLQDILAQAARDVGVELGVTVAVRATWGAPQSLSAPHNL